VPETEQLPGDGDEGNDDVYEDGVEVTYEGDEKDGSDLVWI